MALTDRLTTILRRGVTRDGLRGPHFPVLDHAEPGSRRTLRLAVIGTPRSGNTWLRRVLATAYDFAGEGGWETAVHEPRDADWGAEPARSIVQIHWRRGRELDPFLAEHGVRPIVPRRHPFDVLISILQYATHVQDTGRWIAGEGGDESAIRGLHPNHPDFLAYAIGPRARALLAVSREWQDAPGAVSPRYEHLVERPAETLDGVARALGLPPVVPWATALEANTMDELRKTHGFGHIWKGRPGLWKCLLTAPSAARLAEVHAPLLSALGEDDEFDITLTPEEALANWQTLNA